MADDPGQVAEYQFGTHALWAYQHNGLGSLIWGTAYLPPAPIPIVPLTQFQVPPQADPTQIRAQVFQQAPKPQPFPKIHQIWAAPQADPTQIASWTVKKQPTALPSGVYLLNNTDFYAPQVDPTQIQGQIFSPQITGVNLNPPDHGDVYEFGTHEKYVLQSNGLGSRIFGSVIQNAAVQAPPTRHVMTAFPQEDPQQRQLRAVIWRQTQPNTGIFLTMHPWGARDEYQDIQPQLYSAPPGTVSVQNPIVETVLTAPPQADPTQIQGKIFSPPPAPALRSPTLYASKYEWGTHEKYIHQSQNRSFVQGGPRPAPPAKPVPFFTQRYTWGTHAVAVHQSQNRSFIMHPVPPGAPPPTTGAFLNFFIWGEREEYSYQQAQFSKLPPGTRITQSPISRAIPQAYPIDVTQIQGRIFGAQPPSAVGGSTQPTLLMLGVGN